MYFTQLLCLIRHNNYSYMKTRNWLKVVEKPLEPGIPNSPKAITESKDIPGEIRMFRGTTTLAYGIDEITEAICEPKACMNWVERMKKKYSY